MRQHWLGLVCVAAALALTASASAAERHLDFLKGLRDRGYFDYAQLYLNQLEERTDLPEDVKRVLPYERAVTLLDESRNVRDPDSRRALLEQAQGLFERFAAQNPDDPRTADANHERADIFLERAKVSILEAGLPATEERKAAELRSQARQAIAKARDVFQAASTQYEAAWKAFPTFVDKENDPAQWEAREAAEQDYLQAIFDVAQCTYWEAQTYKSDEPEFKQLLTAAAEQFDAIHAAHRTQIVGLNARTYQARCFELMGDYGKALGLYEELLSHSSTDPMMLQLKDLVLRFKLSVLNTKGDHQLAVNFATQWLDDPKNRARRQSSTGVGILYERAIAREKLAGTLDELDPEHKKLLEMARADAREIRNFPYAEFRDPAIFMEQRLKIALGEEAEDPKNFSDAVVLAQTLQQDSENLASDIAQAKPEEKQKLEQERQFKLAEAARIIRLGLSLAGPEVKQENIDKLRLTLCYLYLRAGRNYEAAVLGEFLGYRLRIDNPDTAQTGAYLALAAYHQEFVAQTADGAAQSEADADFELDRMAAVAEYLAQTWPDSERATQARTLLGQVYRVRGAWLKSAEYFAAVPATAPGFADAQLNAGSGFWNAYLNTASLPEDQKPSQEELDRWTELALQHLRTGLEKKAVPADAPAPADFITAKLTMAQIMYSRKQYDEAIALLTRDPHSVMAAIAVKEGEKRPERGIQSVPFAMLAHQVLLFTQIGKQQTDEALKTLDLLESLVPPDDHETLTQIYVTLGRGLEKELEVARENNPDRFAQLLAAFDEFLGALLQRKDALSYGQLRWVATSYYSLGETLDAEMNPKALDYFQKAATTYQTIIDRAGAEPEFAPGVPLSGFRLLLADSLARQEDFEAAVATIELVIKEKPLALDAQFKAAEILQAWGAAGGEDAQQHFLQAIGGRPVDGTKEGIWGYSRIADKMRVQVHAGREDFREQFHEAIYKRGVARKEMAAVADGKVQTQILQGAKAEIDSFAALNDPTKIPDTWWQKFDALYQEIQRDMGVVPPVALEKPAVFTVAQVDAQPGGEEGPAAEEPDATEDSANSVESPKAAAVPAPDEGGGSIEMIIGIIVLLAALAGTVWAILAMKKKPKRHNLYTSQAGAAPNPFAGGSFPGGNASPARAKAGATTKPILRPQTKSPGEAQPAQTRPASKPKSAE